MQLFSSDFRLFGCYHLTLLKVIAVSHPQRKWAYTIFHRKLGSER